MSDEKIAEALKDAGISQEITCPQAFALSKKAGIPIHEVGQFCTKNRIKIRGCQLGCFK